MARDSTAFRHMAVLALAAMLLVAVAPTVSRVLAATASKTGPVLMEMCTMAGLKLIDVSPFPGGTDDEPATPAAPMGPACDYCVLATPLPIVLLLLFALLPWAPRRLVFPAMSVAPRFRRNMRGLGGQAPPHPF